MLTEALEGRRLYTAVGADITFANHVEVPVGTAPVAVAAADFNGDGNQDLLVADSTTLKAYVLFGNGAGAFSAGPVLTLPGPASSALAVDLNGDNRPDVVVACSPGNTAGAGSTVTTFLAAAGGTFGLGQATTVELGGGSVEPVATAAGDLNGDGHVDLVVTEYASSAVAVLLGTGSGAFAAPTTVAVGTNPTAVAVADLTGDGHLDAAVTSVVSTRVGATGGGDSVSILRGNRAGALTEDYDVALADSGSGSLAAADLNGDGKPDLVVGGQGTTATVLLNTGSTFAEQATVPTDAGSTALAVADFNLDGIADVASVNGGTAFSSGTDTATVIPGNGAGAVGAAFSVSTGSHPVGVAVADFNNDGKPDLVTADEGAGAVSVLLDSTAVTRVTTRTTLALSPAASAPAGSAVTLTATVTPASLSPLANETRPTGTIGFYDGATLLGEATAAAGTIPGTATATFATTTLAVGGHKLTAVYRGDAGYASDASPATVEAVAPTADQGPDLVAAFVASGLPATVVPGSTAVVKVRVTNQGNTAVAGALANSLYLSLDATLDSGDTLVAVRGSLASSRVRLQPNASIVLTGTFTVPVGQPLGTYVPIVVLNTAATGALPESNTANDSAVSATTAMVTDAFGSVAGRANVLLTIADADGTTATFRLTGPGTGTVDATDAGTELTLSGTTARTTVSIAKVAGGDGAFTLDDVSVGQLVGTLRLTGSTVTGTITLGGGAGSASFGTVAGGSLVAGGGVRSLSVAAWTGTGSITAPYVGTLTSKGAFAPALSLTGTGAPAGVALNAAAVGGAVGPVVWSVGGSVNRLSLDSVPAGWSGDVSGTVRQFTVAGDFDGSLAAASIASLTIRGNDAGGIVLAGANFGTDGRPGVGDTYAAGTIGSVRIGGSATAAVIGAGATPTVGGYAAGSGGSIRSLVVTGAADAASRFVAATLPVRAVVGGAVVTPASDPRFVS